MHCQYSHRPCHDGRLCGGYTSVILSFAQIISPDTANGSLIRIKAGHRGSRLIARSLPIRVIWPWPSAVDYNGAGAGGSNKSPTSPDLTERAKEIIGQWGVCRVRLPAELAAASGGGSCIWTLREHAALYQVERVANARGFPQAKVEALITKHAFAPGGALTPNRLVNVFPNLILALDD